MNINELRAEVRKREQAASRKVYRLKANGADISGTRIDPRRNGNIGRYTRQQLTNYLGQLNQFVSRNVQYTAISDGQIVPGGKWREYERLEARYNKIGEADYSRVQDEKLPNSDLTIAQRDATMRPENPRVIRAAGDAVKRLYEPINIKRQNVASEKALDKLIAQRRRQISKTYKPEEVKRQQVEARKMIKKIGDRGIAKAVNSLTDEEFYTLWNYGSFATDLSRDYERMKLLATGGASAEQDKVHEDAKEDILDAVAWAKDLTQKQLEAKETERKRKLRR